MTSRPVPLGLSSWLTLLGWPSRCAAWMAALQSAQILSFVVSRHSWQAGEQALAEERSDPAVHVGERRAVEARRVVHQFGGEAGLSGRKRRERSAVTAVREIDQPLARRAGLEHALAVEARKQPLVLP